MWFVVAEVTDSTISGLENTILQQRAQILSLFGSCLKLKSLLGRKRAIFQESDNGEVDAGEPETPKVQVPLKCELSQKPYSGSKGNANLSLGVTDSDCHTDVPARSDVPSDPEVEMVASLEHVTDVAIEEITHEVKSLVCQSKLWRKRNDGRQVSRQLWSY